MKKILLSLGLLLTVTVGAQTSSCSELFISEYVEGWSNNKALEIYNPTGQAIDLSEYMVIRYSNGASFVGPESGVQLSGTIGAFDVYVAALDKRDPNGIGQDAPLWDSLEVRGDGFYCTDYNVSKAMYFNGNDAVVLAKGTLSDIANAQLVDVFGKIGEDPDNGTYTGSTTEAPYVGVGVDITTDHSLVRKPTIQGGVTNFSIPEFNAMVEWDTLPPVIPMLDANGDPILDGSGNPRIMGNWATLGNHDCECNSLSVNDEVILNMTIYPNPSANGVFTFATESNIVNLEVYSAVGQKVLSQKNKAGIQSFTIGNKPGVYLLNIETSNGMVTSRRVIVK